MTNQEEIRKQLEYSNLLEWHEAGFTGKGYNLWNTEAPGGEDEHSEMVTIRVKHATPDCNVFEAGLEMSSNAEIIHYAHCTYKGIKYEVEEFIKKFNIKVITRSIQGGASSGRADSKFWNELKDRYNLTIFNCAGNIGSDGVSSAFPVDISHQIAACGLSNGKPRRDSYSSIGEEVDFCNFRGFYNGTSFAAPYTAGEAVLIKERYGDISDEEIFKYLCFISEDMETVGKDTKTGYGIPVFPSIEKKYISMTVDQLNYFIDGKELIMDTVPVNKEGNVFVPIRAISEGLGKIVVWDFNDDKSIKITITDDINKVVLNTGSKVMFKNGMKVFLNFAPYVDDNNRTLVPIRAIAEAFGCKVDWIQGEQRVMILEV